MQVVGFEVQVTDNPRWQAPIFQVNAVSLLFNGIVLSVTKCDLTIA
jgi:hypothetical protein